MTLHEMSISEIQQALSAGELSAREIARQTLEAIARINPQINAWTAVTESSACSKPTAEITQRHTPRRKPPCRRWRACPTR